MAYKFSIGTCQSCQFEQSKAASTRSIPKLAHSHLKQSGGKCHVGCSILTRLLLSCRSTVRCCVHKRGYLLPTYLLLQVPAIKCTVTHFRRSCCSRMLRESDLTILSVAAAEFGVPQGSKVPRSASSRSWTFSILLRHSFLLWLPLCAGFLDCNCLSWRHHASVSLDPALY